MNYSTSAVGSRRLALAAIVATTMTVWLGVLPWLASQPCLSEHLQRMRDRGLDASAMTYSELPRGLMLDAH